jgi:S-adenosylmethionine:tRNA ribosyltransferase-isomerase
MVTESLQHGTGKPVSSSDRPYSFQVTDAVLTNFHLPKSTLMVLVCTFAGHELIQQAYRYAVSERFRFYSYGDAMLIV